MVSVASGPAGQSCSSMEMCRACSELHCSSVSSPLAVSSGVFGSESRASVVVNVQPRKRGLQQPHAAQHARAGLRHSRDAQLGSRSSHSGAQSQYSAMLSRTTALDGGSSPVG